MKHCPECNRNYADADLNYCLEDGAPLLYGSATKDAVTVVLSEELPSEAPTRHIGDARSRELAVHRSPASRTKWIALVTLAALVSAAYIAYRYSRADDHRINSLAVLPFANASGEKDSEYLSDGIAETLINNLTRIPQLRVIARTSSFRLRGREAEPQAIGRELNVGSMLTGSVLQQGDDINIQVDLINTEDGVQLWGNRYEGKVSNVLDIQQKIARDVSEHLRLSLTGAEEQRLTRNYTDNADAYRSYLRGRYYWQKRSSDGIRSALREFQDAIDKDPDYALGYVGVADCYLVLEEYTSTPSAETLPKAKAAVERALQLDQTLAEAHASLGLYYVASWQWNAAEVEFKRAIELNPNYASAHHWYQLQLRTVGRLDEALAQIKRAKELDPLSPVVQTNLANVYLMMGDLPSAEVEARREVDMDPKFVNSHESLGRLFVRQQRLPDAIDAFQHDVDTDRTAYSLASLGCAYGLAGRRDEADAILKELEERYSRHESLGQYVALVYVGLGDKDRAFHWLDKDVQARSSWLQYVVVNTLFDPIRGDPRYTDLKRRMGLAQ